MKQKNCGVETIFFLQKFPESMNLKIDLILHPLLKLSNLML